LGICPILNLQGCKKNIYILYYSILYIQMPNNCHFSMVFSRGKNAQICALEKFLDAYYKRLSSSKLRIYESLNTPQYSYFMTTETTAFQVYAYGYNTNGSIYSTPNSSVNSGPSWILFTGNGTLEVYNLPNEYNLNLSVLLVGGGGGGGAGGGKSYLSDVNGGAGGGGGSGYNFSGTITSSGTYTITVGTGGSGGSCQSSGDDGGDGSAGYPGGESSISGPNNFYLSAYGGNGGGGGISGADGKDNNGGTGGTGGNGGGGNGSGYNQTEGNGGSGQTFTNSFFNTNIYIGGGGGGGNNDNSTSTYGETAGNPQGQYLYQQYGPYWGQGGGNPGVGNGISAAGVQNGKGGASQPSDYWNYVGGGGGGGAGNNDDSAKSANPGGPGGAGANGCVVIYWTFNYTL
jgi:hypothetical protein